MKISVCWIAKNEEGNIARSINSLKDHVDEMIVVDTGSTDRTAEVAAELGARVEHFEWKNDFSAARNFAVSLSSGDVIMCPDADMWYDPPFGQKERDLIEQALKNSTADGVTGVILDVDIDRGVALNEAIFTLAYKRSANLSYHNAIHEQLLRQDGSFMEVAHVPVKVRHSGYSSSIAKSKAARNLALLKESSEAEGRENDGRHKAITDFYLMRENLNHGDYPAAFDSFLALRDNPKVIEELIPYKAITTTYFYIAMNVASIMRSRVSREDIYENLVKKMRNAFPKHSSGDMLELMYQIYFDFKDDVFMKELKKRTASFDPRSSEYNSDSTKAFAILCAKAALVCRRRGETEKAFDYCITRIRASEIFDPDTFSILLSCIKGQPEPEIILFLNSLFPMDAPTQAHALAEGLIQDGFQTAFKYFVMKQLEKGVALKKHFLQLLILNGNYQEAVDRAVEMRETLSDELFSEIVFLAMICSHGVISPSLAEHLNPVYTALYSAMKGLPPPVGAKKAGGETPVGEPTADAPIPANTIDKLFIHRIFNQLVFFSGLSDAYSFLMLFSGNPETCFFIEAKYCIDNGLYDNLLFSKLAVGLSDDASKEIILIARILGGRHADALAQIKSEFGAYRVSQSFLNCLLTLADKAAPHIAEEARALYDKHLYLYDEFTDLEDVLKTGLVFDKHNRRDKKAFKEMTLEGFKKLIGSDAHPTDHLTYLMTIGQAAKIYEEKGLHTMALGCYARLCACAFKEKENLENIRRVFKKIGNNKLAAELGGAATA